MYCVLSLALVFAAASEQPGTRMYQNRLTPIPNPKPLLADHPEYVEPIRETARFEDSGTRSYSRVATVSKFLYCRLPDGARFSRLPDGDRVGLFRRREGRCARKRESLVGEHTPDSGNADREDGRVERRPFRTEREA